MTSLAPHELFVDDHELLLEVLNGNADNAESFVERFLEDHPLSSEGKNNTVNATISLPERLQSEGGQKHLTVTQSILQVSQKTAVQLTLGVFVQHKKVADLLGSLQLVASVIQHYYRQRTARLQLLSELMRLNECPRIDHLFERLTAASTQPDMAVSYERLSTLEQLGDDQWRVFSQHTVSNIRKYQETERLEALESLLVLLYDRPTNCADLLKLLEVFDHTTTNHTRQSNLQDMILVESMCLWKIFHKDENIKEWKSAHPMLQDTQRTWEIIALKLQEVNNAVGLLAFGLLLHCGGQADGLELAKVANNEMDGFGKFHQIMETMVIPSKNDTELSAQCLAYASIGRELLNTTIFVFKGILPQHKLPNIDNVTRLSGLCHAIFCNSPTLCESFWNGESPLANLWEASQRLAGAALTASGFSVMDLLNAMAPLIQLAASLSYPDVLEDVMKALPKNLLRHALHLALKVDDDLASATVVLQSIRKLASLASASNQSRDILRDAVNPPTDPSKGPRSSTLSIQHPDLFSIWADLSVDADHEWLLDAWRGVIVTQRSTEWMNVIKSEPSVVRLVVCLIGQLDTIVFKCPEAIVLELLSKMKDVIFQMKDILNHWKHLSYAIGGLVFDLLSASIEQLQRLPGIKTRELCMVILDALISILAADNTLQKAVCFFATAPVSLSIATSLDPLLLESYLLHTAKTDETSMFDKGYSPSPEQIAEQIRKLLIERLSTIDSVSLSLEVACGAGWLGEELDETVPLRSALSALRLLNAWAQCVSGADDKLSDFLGSSPYRLIGSPVPLPTHVRSHALLPPVWESNQISMLSLLVGYLGKKDENDLEGTLAMEAFDLIRVSVRHWRVFSNDDADTILDIFKCMNQSGVFSNVMKKFQETIESLTELSENDLLEIAVLSRYLIMLGGFAQSSPEVASTVMEKAGPDTLQSCVQVVCTMLTDLESGNADAEDLSDVMIEARSQVAIGCLSILCAVWKHSRDNYVANTTELRDFVESDEKLLKALADFAVNVAGRGLSERSGGQGFRLQESIITITSLSLDILATELSYSAELSDFSKSVTIMKAVQEALRGDLTRVVAATRTFATLKGLLPFGVSLKTTVEMNPGTAIVEATPRKSPLDVSLQVTKFYGQSPRKISGMETEMRLLGCELSRLQSWKSFCHTLLRFLKVWKTSGTSFPFSSSPGVFPWSMILTVLQATKESAESVDNIQSLTTTVRVLEHEFLTMAHTCTELLVALIDVGELQDGFSTEQWAEAVASTAEISRNVGRRVVYDPKLFFTTRSYLIASATQLLQLRTSTEEAGAQKGEHESSLLNLALTTCEAIKAAATWEERVPEAKDLLSICMSFLTALVERASSSHDRGFTGKLCRTMQESNAVSSLITQITALSTDKLDFGMLALVLDLCTSIAASSNADMMRLLASTNIVVLLSNVSSSLKPFESYIAIRGYKEVGGHVLGTKRTSDPLHGLWKQSLKLVNVVLRTAKEIIAPQDEVSVHFYRLGCDFINGNRAVVLSCLQQCGSIDFGPEASERKAFSINLLRETSLMLGIVSEIFDDRSKEGLSPDLQRLLESVVSDVVVSLSTILGASGSSREIFRVLANAESGTALGGTLSTQLELFSPAHRLLSAGVQNAKHEAIRYASHFVLNCRHVLTEQEIAARNTFTDHWSGEAQSAGASQSWSMSSLEQKCRSAVANHFSFDLEFEAAYCLFFALDILWKVHPASSAFVMLSYQEAMQMNVMQFVKKGTVIAFRPVEYQSSSPKYFGTDLDEEELEFGRVIHCDVLSGNWRVRLLNPDANHPERTIAVGQLAGIQDRAKRMKPMFSIATSQNSTELELLGKSASVGHLILALQWCGQFYGEQQDAAHLQGKMPVISRLAELTSAFVGLELSIFEESCGGDLFKPSNSQSPILAWQLLDLFGDASDLESGLRPGRLQDVISQPAWNTVRCQLQNYLDGAIDELKTKMGEALGFPRMTI